MNLKNLRSVFYETLRLFPPVRRQSLSSHSSHHFTSSKVVGIPKLSGKDNMLVVHSTSGEETKTIPVPKDTPIILNTAGLHFNPRTWPDPHAFKPERFLDDWPRDSFLPFSGGRSVASLLHHTFNILIMPRNEKLYWPKVRFLLNFCSSPSHRIYFAF